MTDPYTAAWMAELWPLCPEWSPVAVSREPESLPPPRRICPECGLEYAVSYLWRHIRRAHPPAVESSVEKRAVAS